MSRTILIFTLAFAAPGPLFGQGEIFERGNQLYQEGNYLEAIDAYVAVVSAGYDSADLHYNLGNAYFKSGDLGRSILEWERALARAPGDPDVLANLELARSLTVDDVEPLPRFWLLGAVSWWVRLLPRGALIFVVGMAWVILASGGVVRVVARGPGLRAVGVWMLAVGGITVLVFGINLFVRELGIGDAEHAIVLVEEAPVRSAPADQDDFVLFRVHEGTKVRVDSRSGEWAEVVLEDGKVGWVRYDVMEAVP